MNTLSISDFQNKGIKYLTFSNQDGKQWSIPMRNMRVALALYEPSGLKGKLLKKLFPITAKLGVAKRILCGSYTSIQLSRELRGLIDRCFGEGWEYSVFWGTPCVDQKITIQIYKEQKILGYCKISPSERVRELFRHEKAVLDLLQQKGISHVARCLALEEVPDRCWVFVQSTEKEHGAKSEHSFGEKQNSFLDDLWNTTKKSVPFEKTDYYQSLMFLEQHMEFIQLGCREWVTFALHKVLEKYNNQTVEWGVCHRDFTPWNTCIIKDHLFVFDFEYALFYAPKGMDYWHFFLQTSHYERKYDMNQILEAYQEEHKDKKDLELFVCYLLDIIALYLFRGEKEDIAIANQRAQLLNLILERNKMEAIE